MPDQSAHAATLRASGHSVRGWLSIFKGVPIVTATVASIPTVYPFTTLGITVVSGSMSNVERGAEVVVLDSTDHYKGRLRVRYSGTMNATNLPIAEVSKATMEIVVGDKLQILSEHRIRAKFPESSVTFDPDMVDYVDQNSVQPPIPCSGGPVAAWVDEGQTYATLDFFGSSSYAVDPGSGGSLTHAWTFPAGSTPATSTSADPANVQIPEGEWWVRHIVTDSSNSKTWTQFVPVYVHDADNPPYEVIVENFNGEPMEGWGATFTMLDSIGLDDAPDGAPVIFWVKEVMDETEQSFGNRIAERSNIKFFGYLRSDNAQSDASQKTLSLAAVSPLRLLAEMNGFSKVFIDDAAANDWIEIQTLSVKRAIIQILRWYTTAVECCDLIFDFTDFTYPRFYLQKATPLEQLRELADGVDARFIADRIGCLEIQKDPALTKLSDRSGLITTYTLALADVISIQVQREHYRPVDLLECRGIGNVSNLPFFSRYPGKAPGEGNQNAVQDRLIVINQADLNVRCGLRGGRLDRVYITNASRFHFAPTVTVVLFGSYDIFDFYREYIAFSLTGTSNNREIDLSAFRWMLQSVNIVYEQGTATTTLTLQAETAAQQGTTYTPPAPPDNQLPDYELDDVLFVPPVSVDPVVFRAGDNIVCITDTGHLLSTTNFSNASPTWQDVDISGDLIDPVVISFAVDATSPAYLGTGSGVNAWVLTRLGIDYVEDLFSLTPTVTNQVTLTNDIEITTNGGYCGSIDADYTNDAGRFVVATYVRDGSATMFARVTTDGQTWGPEETVEAFTFGSRDCCVAIDPHTAGRAYVFSSLTEKLYVGDNYAGDWSLVSSAIGSNSVLGLNLFFPYAVNPTRYLYYTEPFSRELMRVDLDELSQAEVPLIGDHFPVEEPIRRGVLSIPSANPNRMLVVTQDPVDKRGLILTNNLGDEFVVWTEILALQNTNLWSGCALTDPNGDAAYLWGDGKVGWWDGSTVAVRNGTGFTADQVIAIAGG